MAVETADMIVVISEDSVGVLTIIVGMRLFAS